jgi:maltose-binding protein MalE
VLEFARNASTIPSVKAAFNDDAVKSNKIIAGYNAQADIAGGKAILMPTVPQMSAVWGPVTSALESINTGGDPAVKLAEAQDAIEKQING